jgi:putative phage-type endonuclease
MEAQSGTSWTDWRRKGLGSSDAPVIMGVSPFSTRYHLFLVKKGKRRSEAISNQAIELGKRFEPAVRASFELIKGYDFPAQNLVHPKHSFLKASLDGRCADHNEILEVKVAGEEVYQAALKGKCHEKYFPQVQHQLMVAEAKRCWFVVGQAKKHPVGGSYFLSELAIVEVLPDENYIARLMEEELKFWRMVMEDVKPELTYKDVMLAEDQRTVMLMSELKQALVKEEVLQEASESITVRLNRATESVEELKQQLVQHLEQEVKWHQVEGAGLLAKKNKKGEWFFSIKNDI